MVGGSLNIRRVYVSAGLFGKKLGQQIDMGCTDARGRMVFVENLFDVARPQALVSFRRAGGGECEPVLGTSRGVATE